MFSAPRLGTVSLVAGLLLVAAVAAGCGSPGADAGGSTGDQAFEITTSQLFISTANRSGRPLVGIKISIVPVGRATEFSHSHARLEVGERRDFSLGDFRGDDGTPFSLRVHRPRSVRVTGKDLNGKEYVDEVPWR